MLRISQEGLANQSVKVKVHAIDLSAATPCFFISIFLYTFLIPGNVMCISDDVKSHYRVRHQQRIPNTPGIFIINFSGK